MFLGSFGALDAEAGVGDGAQASFFDGCAAVLAFAVGSILDALDGEMDRVDFFASRFIERFEDLFVFEFDGLLSKVGIEGASFLAEVACDFGESACEGAQFFFQFFTNLCVIAHQVCLSLVWWLCLGSMDGVGFNGERVCQGLSRWR